MNAAILFGIDEARQGQGRNMYPVLGRPLMAYPLLAARHASRVDAIGVSTNSPAMAHVAEQEGGHVIFRPPELCEASTEMGEVFRHAVLSLEEKTGQAVEYLIILLANAPVVTPDLIDRAVLFLDQNPDYASTATVEARNEFNPAHACFVSGSGELVSFLTPPMSRNLSNWSRDKLGDIYFFDNCLRVIRRSALFSTAGSSRLPYPWMGDRTAPIVHQGGFDVDHDWQIPGVERWLRQQGFTETLIPYSKRSGTTAAASSMSAGVVPTTGKVLITTVPFGDYDPKPLDLLRSRNIPFAVNPTGRRLKEEELTAMIGDYEVLIAGTEPITRKVLERARNLRMISRVGIGLDSVDLEFARERGIQVTYTPDAPSAAVSDLTIGQILALLRKTMNADHGMRQGVWHRWVGRRLGLLTVGVIGVGRVGRRVIHHLQGWSPIRVLANDVVVDDAFSKLTGCVWTSKETIYREADIITLHLPLTAETRNMIAGREIDMMKPDAVIINMARGGIINEAALAAALRARPALSAAVDVFVEEPYGGELANLENCVLTCHMGSCTVDCRLRMEVEATEEALRYFDHVPFVNPVPEFEYALRASAP